MATSRPGGWGWGMRFALVLAWLGCGLPLVAQPPNDNCTAATDIPLGAGNFGIGVYSSAQSDLTGATLQFGEPFHAIQVSGGTDKKTVWYRFTLPTHRGVRVELRQPANNIPQADAGFTVFYASACMPTLADIPPAKLTPLNKFGSSFNTCLEPGVYYIQVSAKDNPVTNFPIFLDITTSYPSVLNTYDRHVTPHAIGTVSGNTPWYDFDIGCLTIEATTEQCAALGATAAQHTQSSWHTFTTDNFVDFLRVELRMQNFITGGPNWRVGYILYQGNAATAGATPWTTLPVVDACQVLDQNNTTRDYRCQLLPNTTYSIQILHHKDVEASAGIRILEQGTGNTLAPNPLTIPAAHQLGNLPGSPAGVWTTRNDVWGCNARMSLYRPCGTTINADYNQGGYTYDMNDWVTFTLTSASNVQFNVSSGCIPSYVRIYTGNVGGNCSVPLYQAFTGNTTITCMPAGTYSMQVLGVSGGAVVPNCNNSHLTQNLSIQIGVTTVTAENQYGLQNANRSDTVNRVAGVHQPLPNNVTVYSTNDRMGCNNTVMPTGGACGTATKATYRVFIIGDSDGDGTADYGTLTIGGLNCNNFTYRLYSGNARALAIGAGTFGAAQTIPGMTALTACFCNQTTLCLDPGTYTLVTFGDANDVGASDQPWFRFSKTESQFNLLTANRVNRVNYGGGTYFPLTSGTSYTTTLDAFDCHQTVLPAGNVCGGNTKAIYRTFRVGANGLLMVYGNCGNTYKLYSGDASALANAQGLFNPDATYPDQITGLTDVSGCFGGYCGGFGWCDYSPTIEICVTPGLYTLVSFTDDNVWNVGRTDQPTIRFDARDNLFNLANAGRFNNINGGVGLNLATNYTSTAMHFDCIQTVLPAGDICGAHDRAMYRIFTVTTGGVLTVSGLNSCFAYRLYGGNAATLATSYTYPNTIAGLNNLGLPCYTGGGSITYCISPGTYTLVSFGDYNDRGLQDQPVFRIDQPATDFYNPPTGNVNAMGNANAGAMGIQDTFSCIDNPLTIDGMAPCNGATKQIYREFILTQPTYLSISGGVGTHRLFTGWASEAGGYGNLQFFSEPAFPLDPDNDPDPRYNPVSWDCFTGRTTSTCHALPPGKYTIVTYGTGANVNQPTNVTISLVTPLPTPKYNRPYKAYVANGGAPLTWCAGCDGVAYPVTRQQYTFDFDRYDCTKDLPNGYLDVCNAPGLTYNRTSYFVFTLSQESYVRINNIPNSFRQRLYPLDVRTADSLRMNPAHPSYIPPTQNCLFRQDHDFGYWCGTEPGEMEFCRLQPGTYTLVLFATNDHIGTTVQPIVVVEKVETPRFDHARSAYDFGAVPGNTGERFGRNGDTNPLHAGRAPSNDFFSCRAGAQPLDPSNNCPIGGYPIAGQASVPYPMPTNHAVYERWAGAQEDTTKPIIRRSLWYTFVINGAGNIRVRVYNRTTGETAQYPWSIYASDVNGSLPFATVVSTGQVDSTLAQGLSPIANSGTTNGWCGCLNVNQLSFTRAACNTGPTRYYVVVDHNAFLELNNQVEVSVQYDSIPSLAAVYDYVSQANWVNGLNQVAPPYTPVTLTNGTYMGDTASFICATKDVTDQNTCGDRTLWYRLDINTNGRIWLNYDIIGGGTGLFNTSNLMLFRDVNPANPNDTIPAGMLNIPLSAINANGQTWGEACITPGVYYVMLTGCSYTTQRVVPRFRLINRPVVYDHYSQANAINGLNQVSPPYSTANLTNGTYLGDTATFACATKDVPDQNACGTRTLWWYVDVGTTGKLRVNWNIIGSGWAYDPQNVMVFRSAIPGDSTVAGLVNLPLTAISASGANWGQTCVTPGRYYIMLTGCWYTTQDVVPRIQVVEEPGDFCTNPLQMNLNGSGTTNASATIDCHTIGEAFGEDGSNMGCLFGPAGYKSTWFKVTLTTGLKVDLTFQLAENTTAGAPQIRYRVMYGTCGAMTAGPCNNDALTEFTLNCMESGDYYVQVVTPINATGNVALTVTTVTTPDQNCTPFNPLIPVANFTLSAACEGEPVTFNNQSTQGADMEYSWNFGDGSPLSNDENPTHVYPITGTVTTYPVTLIATNTVAMTADTITINVTMYPAPTANITRDAPYNGPNVPSGNPIQFHCNAGNTIATPPTMYSWVFSDGQTSNICDPIITPNVLGTYTATLYVINGTCTTMVTQQFLLGFEPIFNGGPYDGADMGRSAPACPVEQVFAGGPYDGADMGRQNICTEEQVFAGGPYDGADMGRAITPCEEDSIFAGGPYDGADMGRALPACPEDPIFAGGPFDGEAMADDRVLIDILAGNDTLCQGQSVTLGATLIGGVPTAYLWQPGGATTATITVSPATSTLYTVWVTPGNGCMPKKATIFIHVINQAFTVEAGPDRAYCGTQTVQLGSVTTTPGLVYAWTPAATLNNATLMMPMATPTVTTKYYLYGSQPGGLCPPRVDSVTLTISPLPAVLAGNDTLVCPATNAELIGTGANAYVWEPQGVALTQTALAQPLANGAFTGSGGGTPSNAKMASGSGWIPTTSNTSQWLQIDLGALRPIYRIATMGYSCCNYWVASYIFSYSRDGITWFDYSTAGSAVVFPGNVDMTSTVTHTLPAYISARYVRFRPQTWGPAGIGIRAEVYTAPQLSLNNPYYTATVGNYITHGHADACPQVFRDTVAVANPGQTPMQYRSRQNGNWTDLTTWQVYDAGTSTWVNAESFGPCGGVPYPTHRSLTVQVRDSVVYNFTIPIGVDEVTIDPPSAHNSTTGGVVFIPMGITLNLVDSSATPIPADIQNDGRLVIQGTFTPIGAGLLVNADPSTVAYVANTAQTMWNGQYGRLEAKVGGVKYVGGTSTLVRTQVMFQNAHIRLDNRNIVLDTACTITGSGFTSGYFITNALGQVVKRQIGPGATPTFEFPVGHDVTSFNKAILTNAGTVDEYRVRVWGDFEYEANFPADELQDVNSVDRTWHLDEATVGGSSLTLDVYWITAHENATFDRTNSSVGHYFSASGWDRLDPGSPAPGAGTNANPYHQLSTGITSLSPFSVGSCDLTPLDYRTIADGDWTDVNIWEVWIPAASQWLAASVVNTSCGAVSYPTALSRTVQVRHAVQYDYTIPIGVDQVTIATTGHLTVPAGIELFLADGPGSDFATASNGRDLDNLGYFEITGAFTLLTGSPLLVNQDPSTVHYNGGNQPLWNGSYSNLILDGPLPVNAASLKTVSGNATQVRTSLRFANAKMVLGGFNCELLAACSVISPSQNTGYMVATGNGYCVWHFASGAGSAHTFPVGGTLYSPAVITFASVTTEGTLLGRIREVMHPTRYTIRRYWTLTQGSIVFNGTYNGTFHYHETDLPVFPTTTQEEYDQVVQGGIYNPAYLQPGGWRLSPYDIVCFIDVAANTGTMVNNAFSDFTFMPVDQPLPIEDIMLAGQWAGRNARLKWTVTGQPGVGDRFELLRSTDLQHFEVVATVDATQELVYPHLDETVADASGQRFYYQVRHLNISGMVLYSNVVELTRRQGSVDETLTIYPNPVNSGGLINLSFTLAEESPVELEVFDMTGRIIGRQTYMGQQGENTQTYPVGDLSQGTYFFRVRTHTQVLTKKVLVVRQ